MSVRRVPWDQRDPALLPGSHIVGRVEIRPPGGGLYHGLEIELASGQHVAVFWDRVTSAFALVAVTE